MTDWLAEIHQRGELAKQLAKEVPPLLYNDALTLDQATRIYQQIEGRAQECERLVEAIEEDDDAPEDVLEAAESLCEIYDTLARAAADRMVMLRK